MGNFCYRGTMNTSTNGEQPAGAPFRVDSMTAEERIALGMNVRQWREDRGLTAMSLSAQADVDRKTLRDIETGKRAGHPSTLRSILEALDIAQEDDFDKFSERTQSFIYSAAPIFDQLPDAMKDEAQNDVVVLLAGKLARSTVSNVTPADFGVGAREEDEIRQRNLALAASEQEGWQKQQEEENEWP